MCTLTIKFNPRDDYSIIIAANRDEFYTRSSSPPTIIETDPIIFAPQDLEAGGTWFGINEYGLAAMITNVWTMSNGRLYQGETSTRSRGQLTLDVLRCPNVKSAKIVVQQKIEADIYQFFNLAVLSYKEGIVFSFAGEIKEFPLSPGEAIILNTPYHSSPKKPDRLPQYTPEINLSDNAIHQWLSEVQNYLSQHPDYCKHNEFYGTRSSQIVLISKRDPSADGHEPLFQDRMWYADGPPCDTTFIDFSPQLQKVTAGSISETDEVS
ncbi:MAG: NRDE family protein [Candidatus Marinimicrobia bacterium]|nr:NRDE family protein [Candidatus Neomarinimicrobiota bacterium]